MPAATPNYGEVVKAIRGTMLTSDQPKALAQAAGRLVRRTGVDTTINNALRDGAEWAWVPSGDTCAFCMMLASNGWQKASKKAIKNGHASHIHANCDCTYAIRFDGVSTVEGYDPDYYKSLYDNAKGEKWQDKLNSMRRDKYAVNRDKINAQKRMAYANRKKAKMRAKVELPSDFGTPGPGKPLSEQRIREIVRQMDDAGIVLAKTKSDALGGFLQYRGDPEVLEQLAKTVADNRHIWGKRNKNMPIRLGYKVLEDKFALAEAHNGIIWLNKQIFDDTDYLKKYYNYLATHGTGENYTWFVPGTDYRSIILHEIGHRLTSYDTLSYTRLRDAVMRRSEGIGEFCLNNLSEYAMMHNGKWYGELMSEMASALLSTDENRRVLAKEILTEVFGS